MQREATYGERDTGRDEKLRGSRGGGKKKMGGDRNGGSFSTLKGEAGCSPRLALNCALGRRLRPVFQPAVPTPYSLGR